MLHIKKEKVLLQSKDIFPSSNKFEVIGVINPAAARLPDGKILLYVRVIERLKKYRDKNYYYSPRFAGKETLKLVIDKFKKEEIVLATDLDFSFKDGTKRLTFISHLRRVLLDSDGFKVQYIEQKPSFSGLEWDGELGVEDPRITRINNLYIMTYVGLSRTGNVSTNLAISNDCKKWYRRGIIFGHQNKDVVIFPEMINKRYIAFNRPEGSFNFSPPTIWISYSPDLTFWGESSALKISEKGNWDSARIGSGAPPIKTKKGWLFIYHGVIEKHLKKEESILNYLENFLFKRENIKDIYCAGILLLDSFNPKKIIGKSKNPIILPIKNYEKGTFEDKDVVFPTGLVLDNDGKHLLIYSGGGDIVTTVKKISLEEIFEKI